MKLTKASNEAEEFYGQVLQLLNKSKIPFLIGGTYAVRKYTGIERETKDMDCFCKAGDYMKILHFLSEAGFKVDPRDERWLAKVSNRRYFIDFVFGSVDGLRKVDERWFEDAPFATIFGVKVKVTPPEVLIWSKSMRYTRDHYDGADVIHLILKTGSLLNWKKLLELMDPYWEILLVHLLTFRFIYPSERKIIPKWLMKELLARVEKQMQVGASFEKVSRGPLLSPADYEVDIEKWGFQGPHNVIRKA